MGIVPLRRRCGIFLIVLFWVSSGLSMRPKLGQIGFRRPRLKEMYNISTVNYLYLYGVHAHSCRRPAPTRTPCWPSFAPAFLPPLHGVPGSDQVLVRGMPTIVAASCALITSALPARRTKAGVNNAQALQ